MNTDTPELAHVETPAPPSTEPHPATIYSDQERSLARRFQSATLDQPHFVSFGDALRAIAYLADELCAANAQAGRDRDAQSWSDRATLIVQCATELDEMSNPIAKPPAKVISAEVALERDELARWFQRRERQEIEAATESESAKPSRKFPAKFLRQCASVRYARAQAFGEAARVVAVGPPTH